jgi:hypothetical protein
LIPLPQQKQIERLPSLHFGQDNEYAQKSVQLPPGQRARNSRPAVTKSPSAFDTHSATAGFIQHLALFENVPKEPIAHIDTFF